jgi:hypothetical protein
MTTPIQANCVYPNYFSNVVAPAVRDRLPESGTLGGKAIDHLTNIGPFVDTVSRELCDEGLMTKDSASKAIGFITRTSTTAVVGGAALGLTALGLVAGSPLVAAGVGIAGLILLPPLVEKTIKGIANFAGDLLAGIEKK